MKVIELVKISIELLKTLSKSGGSIDDWRYVPMYEEFQHMRHAGIKYRSVVDMLASEYKVSRSTVERVVKRLSKDC